MQYNASLYAMVQNNSDPTVNATLNAIQTALVQVCVCGGGVCVWGVSGVGCRQGGPLQWGGLEAAERVVQRALLCA